MGFFKLFTSMDDLGFETTLKDLNLFSLYIYIYLTVEKFVHVFISFTKFIVVQIFQILMGSIS